MEGIIPEGQKEEDVKPVYKKEDEEKAENYRGFTLMNTDYKIYAEILRNRLVRELEDKERLADTRMGYRPRRRTMDAIYVPKTGIENEMRKKKGKAYVFFADVKGAFDKVSREELWNKMEEKEIEKQLRVRTRELDEETKSTIVVN